MNCKSCGATLRSVGARYECDCCGSSFSAEELQPKKVAPPAVTTNYQQTNVDTGANVYEDNIAGVLEIYCRNSQGSWSGSGYIIDNSGYAITNAHVAANDDGSPCNDITVRVCGQTLPAKVMALADDLAGSGNGFDLALIKLAYMPTGAKALKLDAVGELRNGESAFVIGNSQGKGTCITRGIISDKSRIVNGKPFIMTDCAVNGGNSGGPIFNHKGVVIGTVTLQGRTHDGSDAEGMNYAIPASIVLQFLDTTPAITIAKGQFELPPLQYCSCPKCGKAARKYPNGSHYCFECGYRW